MSLHSGTGSAEGVYGRGSDSARMYVRTETGTSEGVCGRAYHTIYYMQWSVWVCVRALLVPLARMYVCTRGCVETYALHPLDTDALTGFEPACMTNDDLVADEHVRYRGLHSDSISMRAFILPVCMHRRGGLQ